MKKIDELLEIMAQLRDATNGCPWDLEQDFKSIVPHTLEEAYEVADCIERESLAELPSELGDLLFQVVFYAQLGKEEDLFDFNMIVGEINDKLTRRHPHVFGDAKVSSAAEQTHRWEEQKARERSATHGDRHSALAGLPVGLPALTRAKKLQLRASRVGFDWPTLSGVRDKVGEELAETDQAVSDGTDQEAIAEEMGDLLFACVNWARHLNVDPETALRAANRKFEQRFEFIEDALRSTDVNIEQASLSVMDALWDEAKRAERSEK